MSRNYEAFAELAELLADPIVEFNYTEPFSSLDKPTGCVGAIAAYYWPEVRVDHIFERHSVSPTLLRQKLGLEVEEAHHLIFGTHYLLPINPETEDEDRRDKTNHVKILRNLANDQLTFDEALDI
jgi:hypothetical protein